MFIDCIKDVREGGGLKGFRFLFFVPAGKQYSRKMLFVQFVIRDRPAGVTRVLPIGIQYT